MPALCNSIPIIGASYATAATWSPIYLRDDRAYPRYAVRPALVLGSPMTTLDVEVADVETTVRPAARSADTTKAAIAYLIASGAVAIMIVENASGCVYRVGAKLDPRAASVHWIAAVDTKAVVNKARKIAGKAPDIAEAEAALRQAAGDLRAVLTENQIALERAGAMAQRLDAFVASLRARGAMKQFTKQYKLRRLAAKERGESFVSYQICEMRLRRALVPYLIGGKPVVAGSLFAEVFGGK